MRADFKINGAAFGGGYELVAVDFSYPEDTSRFALTEVTLGIHSGGICTKNLAPAAKVCRAKEITFTGLLDSAHEALEWSKLNKVCPAEFWMP
jgi:enoyl-CoA hydratase/carnithine racemase